MKSVQAVSIGAKPWHAALHNLKVVCFLPVCIRNVCVGVGFEICLVYAANLVTQVSPRHIDK